MAAKVVAYTQKERLLSATLVDKHKLVEDKRTDAATVQMKQAEWENIIATDNNSQGALFSVPRTAIQLKKLWNNLKQKKRKLNTQEKYQKLATGGGSPLEIVDDPVMDPVDVAAPCVDVNLSCPWDSRAIYMNDHKIQGLGNCQIAPILHSVGINAGPLYFLVGVHKNVIWDSYLYQLWNNYGITNSNLLLNLPPLLIFKQDQLDLKVILD